MKIKTDETQMKAIINNKLHEIAKYLFTRSQENIISMGIVDKGARGGLLGSGEIRKTSKGWSVGYKAPYASYQEFGIGTAIGHGTFNPPVDAIKDWVWRNRAELNAGLKKGETKITAKTLDKVSYLIARSIGQKGFKPRPFFRNALDETKHKYSL